MKHLIKIETTEHGVLSVQHFGKDQQWCEAGQSVKVNHQPDAGWGLQQLYYTVGTSTTKNYIDMNTMTFIMPSGNVTIGGVFKRFFIGDWTEGKGFFGNDSLVFVKGPNGQPVAIPIETFVAAIVDGELSNTSENPVMNKVITAALALKQALLVSGENIKTINGISILGEGNIAVGGGGGGGTSLEALGFAAFDEDADYLAGNIVVYDGMTYTFINDHSGEWDVADVEATSLLDLLASGALEVMATDITPKSKSMTEITQKFFMQPTGGDADLIPYGASKLLDIKGNLDESLNPFIATDFVSTNMNLVDPLEFVTIVGKRAYIFPVAAGAWGAYGTTQENNGYIILGGDVDSVYFKASGKPTSTSFGEACPTHTENGKTYYLPPANGWLTIVCNDNVDVPACHIAWSNYNDDKAGTFDNTVKSINTDIQWIHAWGMAFLQGGGRSVYDEVDYRNGKRYRRTDRNAMPSMTWVREVITTEGGTTYVYTSTIATMAANGLWRSNYADLEFEGNTAIIRSSVITTVEDLLVALADKYVYFELASVASSNTTTSPDSVACDFGLSYFMNGTELASVPAFVTEAFYQGGKDQLFNAVTYQKILAEVLAAAVCELDSRLTSIEDKLAEGFNYLKVTNLEVTRSLVQPE